MTTDAMAYPEWPRRAPAAAPAAALTTVPEQREGKVAFAGLMLFTFVLLVAPQAWFPALAPLRPALVVAFIAAAAHVISSMGTGRPMVRMTLELKLGLALALWALVTVPLSWWPGGSLNTFLDVLAKSLIIFWLLTATVNTPRRFRLIAGGLCVMTVPAALTAVRNFGSGITLGATTERVLGYEAALSGNPNDLALLLNLVLPFAVAFFLASSSGLRRFLFGGLIALLVTGVVVSFSRAGFITLVAIVAAHLVKFRRRRERGILWAALGLAVVALPLLPGGYVDRLSTIFDPDSDPTGSAQTRRLVMETAFGYLVTHPVIGAGLGQNMLMLNERLGPQWTAVHNTYLEYGVDLGWPGLAIFLALLVWGLKNAAAAARRWETGGADRELFFLAQGLHISLIGFAVAAVFQPSGYHFPFYYLVGLSVALRELSLPRSRSRPHGGG